MSRTILAVCVVVALMGLAQPLFAAVTVVDGGSVLNAFQIQGRWKVVSPSGYYSVGTVAVVQENGQSVLYGTPSALGITRLTIPVPAPGVQNYTYNYNSGDPTDNTDDVRGGGGAGLTYWPNYDGSGANLLLYTGTYAPEGSGYVGGPDGLYRTIDTGDTPVVTGNPGYNESRYHSGTTYVPAAYTWTNTDAIFTVNRTQNLLRQFELNSTKTALIESTLPGRVDAEFSRSTVYNLPTDLGNSGLQTPLFVDYTSNGGLPTLYLFVTTGGNNNLNQTYGMLAITPGPDGKFGQDASGAIDDAVTGYYFGEGDTLNGNGNYNTMQVQKQHIVAENAPGDTSLADLDGGYSIGYSGAAYDPATGYIYLSGGGDFGAGIVINALPVPEPATMAFLAISGLGLAGAAIRRRRAS